MKFENTKVYNFDGALRAMRNPMDSWDRSDSSFDNEKIVIGPNDMKLCKQLINSGTEHRKFLRMIQITVDITAPFYWWKEMMTYSVGTTVSGTSTMHKIQAYPITQASFETSSIMHRTLAGEEVVVDANGTDVERFISNEWNSYVSLLEGIRNKYNSLKKEDPEKAKEYWKALIQMLPSSWLQKRTMTMSYENAYNMYKQRQNHKLTEWRVDFIDWVTSLPYFKEFFID